MLGFLDVIWVFDRTTRPPKNKMYVCLSFEEGWFLRINSSDKFRPCVALSQLGHAWLDHDSFIECALLELDEFEIEDAVFRGGIIGSVDGSLASSIADKLLSARYLRPDDKQRLKQIFNAP